MLTFRLQEKTQVPFRCVDEINQGMDEKNERRVWELLVENAKTHSAQFFYLAPKFPRQLVFDDHMHIHVCYNGELGVEHTDKAVDIDNALKHFSETKSKKRKIA